MRIKLILAFTAFALLFGCQLNNQPVETSSQDNLTVQTLADVYNVQWTLTNATTDTGAISLTNLGPFVLMLSTNDSVFGKAGCNYYYGNYSFDGVQVTISIFGQTEMGCSKPYLLPLQTLDGTWTYILGDTVLILNRGNESRTFVSYYTLPLTNFPAVGATWVLTESNHPRFDEVRNATQFRVQIAPDRRMEIRWASVTNATDTNRVTGYFNRGENNGAFVHWWRWYYTGSWSPANPPADMALVGALEDVRHYTFNSENTVMELRTDGDIYFQFQKQ